MDPGTPVLEGSDVQKNWAMDFGSVVGGGGGNKAGEAEDVLGAIPAAGAAAAPLPVPGVDGNGDRPSLSPRPHLHREHHW